jgi:alanyl-tRNA synthetase
MVQFKDIFLGNQAGEYNRAVSCQKCVRAGGKHNDLENVGKTARHHTFFEMLGNFSFGDYFKSEAIRFAWEYLTTILKLPVEKLWVSVFEQDDEAFRIWQREIGVSTDRIVRMGEKDNFWSMGDTGPCGPCSEIVIDRGEEFGCGETSCRVGCECDRYLELWNLVFMEFNRHVDGTMTKLPHPSIDTGMGLERITAVLQGARSNFDTDLFHPIFEALYKILPGTDGENSVSSKVIADHIRAAVFMISDGILPANEGRGYVLRRILRRAIRHGWMLELKDPFMHTLSGVVTDTMADVYPELEKSRAMVSATILHEEERFAYTLTNGMSILNKLIRKNRVSGAEIFKLYDTYGFPLDLAREILQEKGMGFSQEDFDTAMEEQRTRARRAWKGSGEESLSKPVYREFCHKDHDTIFLGYDQVECNSQILGIISGNQAIEEAQAGQQVEIILDQTTFYAEMGGQVADTGILTGEGIVVNVTGAIAPVEGITVHLADIKQGTIRVGSQLTAQIDTQRRNSICQNHTTTHILHAVLQEVLGDHVKQAGSLVSPDRLRFDFTHISPISPDTIRRIEEMVNKIIQENYLVSTTVMSLEKAMRMEKIQAHFGEKYEDAVRVVEIPDISVELCGGTHCSCSGDIYLFRIVSESGIASGVRRIEAITCKAAYQSFRDQVGDLETIADLLKAPVPDAVNRLEKLLKNIKIQEKELENLKTKLVGSSLDSIIETAEEVDGVRVVTACLDSQNPDGLRKTADTLRDRIPSSVVVLASHHQGKTSMIVALSKNITSRLSAAKLIKELSGITGGKGGGRPDMAQAGGGDPKKLDSALKETVQIVRNSL